MLAALVTSSDGNYWLKLAGGGKERAMERNRPDSELENLITRDFFFFGKLFFRMIEATRRTVACIL
jgi:hypothetical protein